MRTATGTIHVFTFKAGLLSRVAHDLRLELERFEIQLDGERVLGRFDLKSLLVEGPVRDGVLDVEAYDAKQRAEVEHALHDEVLHTARHPQSVFQGHALEHAGGFRVNGELALCGQSSRLSFEVHREQGVYRAGIELVPSRFGIAPYKALLGAIRLQDRVRVELALSER